MPYKVGASDVLEGTRVCMGLGVPGHRWDGLEEFPEGWGDGCKCTLEGYLFQFRVLRACLAGESLPSLGILAG